MSRSYHRQILSSDFLYDTAAEQRSNYPFWAETEHHYTSLFVISNGILIHLLPVCPVRENHRFQWRIVFGPTGSNLMPKSRSAAKGQCSLTGFVVYNTRMLWPPA
jgi:hypothetical protein